MMKKFFVVLFFLWPMFGLAQTASQVEQLGASLLGALNSHLLTLKSDFTRSHSAAVYNFLKNSLESRARLAVELFEYGQGEIVARGALPANFKQDLPVALWPLIEEEKWLEGEIEIVHFDDFANKKFGEIVYLRGTDGQSRRLEITDRSKLAVLRSGARARAPAVEISDLVAGASKSFLKSKAGDAAVVVSPEAGGGKSSGTGIKKTAVIVFKFARPEKNPFNRPLVEFSVDDYRQAVFAADRSVASYYNEGSYGKMQLTGALNQAGDVFGPYTINMDNRRCLDRYQDWARAAETLAVRDGYQRESYDLIIFGFPWSPSCEPLGAGWAIPNADNVFVSPMFLRDGYFDQDLRLSTLFEIVAHEVGHSLGLYHSNLLTCSLKQVSSTGFYGNRPLDGSSPCLLEYGDPYGLMGIGATGEQYHFNNYQKAYLGWLPESGIKMVEKSGVYQLAPLNNQTGTRALLIPWNIGTGKDIERYYYLEYRQPYGKFDDFSSNSELSKAVAIRLGTDYRRTHESRSTLTEIDDTWLVDFDDRSPFVPHLLVQGKIFEDQDKKIKIKTISVDKTGATVEIQVDEGAPVVNIVSPILNANGSLPSFAGAFQVKANYQDNGSVISAVLRVDGQVVDQKNLDLTDSGQVNFALNDGSGPAGRLSVGRHAIQVVALDVMGNRGSATLDIIVKLPENKITDTAGPVINLANDLMNTLREREVITVGARATDPSGISRITIGMTGRSLYTCDNFTRPTALTQSCYLPLAVPAKDFPSPTLIAITATDNSPEKNFSITTKVFVRAGDLWQSVDQ